MDAFGPLFAHKLSPKATPGPHSLSHEVVCFSSMWSLGVIDAGTFPGNTSCNVVLWKSLVGKIIVLDSSIIINLHRVCLLQQVLCTLIIHTTASWKEKRDWKQQKTSGMFLLLSGRLVARNKCQGNEQTRISVSYSPPIIIWYTIKWVVCQLWRVSFRILLL